jgi:serine/threonine-protein kinase
VVHRDIKPENILLHDGHALVADFGIALAASKASGTRMTETGMSLGTPHYMSPEQAMGEREITARSDVYSLGAVLYEMLTGDPPFTGSTAQAVVARVVTESPRPLLPQRHTIPPHVEAAALIALEKLPADRFATAAQFAEALARPGMATVPTRPGTGISASDRSRRGLLAGGRLTSLAPWGIALLAVGGAALVLWIRHGSEQPRQQLVRFDIQLPRDAEPVGATGSTIAFSPDGSQIVYVGKSPSGQRLWSRRLDSADPNPIAGTEGGSLPFFSPDGQWMGFSQGGKLVKVAVAGGPVTTIARVDGSAYGASWAKGDTIVFAGDSGLMDVPAAGGTPRLIARPDTGEAFRFPEVLPDGRAAVFGVLAHRTLKLAALLRETGKIKRLAQQGGYPRYVTAGFLVLSDPAGIISAVPFDAARLEVTGSARAIADNLLAGPDGDINVGVSRAGHLGFQASTSEGEHLLLLDRQGLARGGTVDSGYYYAPRLSPDGRRVALVRGTTSRYVNRDIWVIDLAQHTRTRVTFDTTAAQPLWSPDSRQLAYPPYVEGTLAFPAPIRWVPADGSGAPRPLVTQPGQWTPEAFEPDGRGLVYSGLRAPQARQEIWRVGTDSGAVPRMVLATSFDNSGLALSPDGRWMAYVTNESGRDEVYVRPYPGPGGRWQVSLDGGSEPVWSTTGEIFYRVNDDVMAAAVQTRAGFAVTGRTKLFTGVYERALYRDHNYDVSRDGQTFVMLQRVVGARQAIVVTLNWFDQFRAEK